MDFKVKAKKREVFGKNASRRIRREGRIPAVFYGPDISSVPLIFEKKDIFMVLKSETGENTIFKVSFDSETKDAMIKEIQKDPVTDEILHADLIQITLGKILHVSVPVVSVGEAVGIKSEGGIVDFVTREVEVECLPKNIPEHIEIDISDLHLNQSMKVRDVIPPEGVKIVSDPDDVIVNIGAPVKEEEIEEPEKEAEEVIGEEEEPEVIKKEKEEKEKEEEEKKEERKE